MIDLLFCCEIIFCSIVMLAYNSNIVFIIYVFIKLVVNTTLKFNDVLSLYPTVLNFNKSV